MAKPGALKRKKANGYKMPEPLPAGLIVQDMAKNKWKLGPSIGKGGFGEIYSAQDANTSSKSSAYPYVIKIEPHANGPLFVEMHFYMRNAKSSDIKAFMAEKKLTSLGIPEFVGSGSHEYNGEKYRFVVMPKFGSDIWKLFLENNRHFPDDTVFKLGIQILDVLEYIHSKGYIHADIKGANVLLGNGKESNSQVYLVDFGLCTRYSNSGKPDPKKAHNGTIEYLSRDAHLGVETRRGDLEILGYNLVQWFGGILPWEKNLSDPVVVQKSKEKHMNDLPKFFDACFNGKTVPDGLRNYMKYVVNLEFDTEPDYKKLRKILVTALESVGGSFKLPLKFKSTPLKRKSSTKTVTLKKKSKKSDNKDDSQSSIEQLNNKKITKLNKNGKQKLMDDETEEEDTEGYTAEMLRIKDKLNAKKTVKTKKKSNTARSLRTHKNNESDSDLVSDSEDEYKSENARKIISRRKNKIK